MNDLNKKKTPLVRVGWYLGHWGPVVLGAGILAGAVWLAWWRLL